VNGKQERVAFKSFLGPNSEHIDKLKENSVQEEVQEDCARTFMKLAYTQQLKPNILKQLSTFQPIRWRPSPDSVVHVTSSYAMWSFDNTHVYTHWVEAQLSDIDTTLSTNNYKLFGQKMP
jgi:hypothetical protein